MMPSLSTSPISTRCWTESSPPQKSEPCPRCFGRSAITSTPWNNLEDRATESTESGDWGIPNPAGRIEDLPPGDRSEQRESCRPYSGIIELTLHHAFAGRSGHRVDPEPSGERGDPSVPRGPGRGASRRLRPPAKGRPEAGRIADHSDRPLVGREFPTMAHQGVHHRRTRRRNEGERGNHRHGNFRAPRVLSLDVYEFLAPHALEFDQAQALVEPRRHNQRRPPRIAAYRHRK